MREQATTLVAGIAFAALACNAEAAPVDATRRPCTHDDIVGTWDMIDIKTNFSYDRKNTWYMPYQILSFGNDGSFRHWASSNEPGGSEKKLLEAMAKSETYRLDDSTGHLDTRNTVMNTSVNYTCLIYTRDSGANKKGDMLLAAGQVEGAMVIKVLQKEGTENE